jgi:hypothetical protein
MPEMGLLETLMGRVEEARGKPRKEKYCRRPGCWQKQRAKKEISDLINRTWRGKNDMSQANVEKQNV